MKHTLICSGRFVLEALVNKNDFSFLTLWSCTPAVNRVHFFHDALRIFPPQPQPVLSVKTQLQTNGYWFCEECTSKKQTGNRYSCRYTDANSLCQSFHHLFRLYRQNRPIKLKNGLESKICVLKMSPVCILMRLNTTFQLCCKRPSGFRTLNGALRALCRKALRSLERLERPRHWHFTGRERPRDTDIMKNLTSRYGWGTYQCFQTEQPGEVEIRLHESAAVFVHIFYSLFIQKKFNKTTIVDFNNLKVLDVHLKDLLNHFINPYKDELSWCSAGLHVQQQQNN